MSWEITAKPPYPTQISAAELVEEIETTDALLQNLQVKGAICSLPLWRVGSRCGSYRWRAGLPTIMWTIDTIDWQKPGVAVITSRVLDNLAPGSIILAHPTEQQ